MIKIGDIVYLKRMGGIIVNQSNTSLIGLVIKEHKERGAIPQYHVQFAQNVPKWFYQHELCQIRAER